MSMPSIEDVRVLAARCAAAGDAELEQAFEERFALPLQRFCSMDQVQQVEYLQGLQDGSVQRPNSQVHTSQFKAWFGDSKVVDAYGRPLVVYHGTEAEFRVFDSWSGVHWFTDDPRAALGEGGNLVAAYLSIVNPYFWKEGDKEPDDDGVRGELIAKGYDGVIAPSNIGEVDYIAFYPNQIKSAIGNSGSFDPNNPDITDGAGRELLKRLVQPNIGCRVVNAARASGVPTIFFSP